MLKKHHTGGLSVLVAAVLVGGGGAGSAPLGAQDLLITEFMAVNESTLQDEDGDYSDWLEIFNADTVAVNLNGWFLTDDPFDLGKWRLPAVTLQPGAYLVVFASGKDRRVAGAELHTNFKLTSTGELLALVASDAATLVSAYIPYPEQVGDFSYGVAQNGLLLSLVGPNAASRTLIPADGALSLTWTQQGFNHNSWTSGTTGVGYDRNPDYVPLIGTDVRAAMDGVNATAYVRIPFTLDDPSEVQGLTLRVKYDDGFAAYLNGTRVEARNAPGLPTWNSTATALHDDSVAVIFEEYDISSFRGSLRAGENILAIHGLNESTGSSDFIIFPELDGTASGELERDVQHYFPRASPGAPNLQGYPGIASKPVMSPAGGVFNGTANVTLSVGSAGTAIRYTLDGSEPTQSSVQYSSPLSITASTMVRAKGFEPGLAPSPTVSEGYIALGSDVVNFNSNLPVVLVDNFGRGGVPQDPLQTAFLAIFEPGTDGRTRLSSAPTLQTRIGIKVRGSTSAGEPKKSYRLETWDEKNVDKDVEPLGFAEESDWILYGAYQYDRALMRNAFIFELSNQVGRYATRTRFVEVYFNTGGGTLAQADYAGVYSFMESIKRGPDRVDVEKLTASDDAEPDITGGYMVKIDRLDPGDSGFNAGGRGMGYAYPQEDDISPAQATWIQNYINTMVNTINGASFADPVNGYARYLDADSWVDHHILNVLPKNVDALRLSTYMFKARNGRYEYGPIWDFDRSMNSTDGRDDAFNTWNGTGDATDFFGYPWWGRLFQDPEFYQKWRDHWHEFRLGPLSENNIRAIISTFAGIITEAQARDFAKWGLTSPSGWQTEITNLQNWLANRANWIDTQFTRPPVFSRSGGTIPPGFQLTITAPAGTIYYTLDGSDPRLRGGNTASGAVQYTGPVVLTDNARVVARARVTAANWSAATAGTFVVETPSVVISELMFHPPDPPPASPYSADEFEFVEFLNIGAEAVDLAGARVSNGIELTFPAGAASTLLPGEYAVAVRSLAAFATRYDTAGMHIIGEYARNLSNAGDRIKFEGPLRELILDFNYDDLWYPTTDGQGDSLVIVDPLAPRSSWGTKQSWAPGTVFLGSPGSDDGGFPNPGGYQLPGDSNQDGTLDVSDAFSLLRRLFPDGAPPPLPCDGAGLEDGGNLLLLDVTNDGRVLLGDALSILNYLFANGPAPLRGSNCVRMEGCPNVCGF